MAKQPCPRLARKEVTSRVPPSNRLDALAPWGRERAMLLVPPVEVALAGPVPLRRIQSFLVPGAPGVYVIHDLRGVLYAGRTGNLRRRFGEHAAAMQNELIHQAQQSAFGVLAFSWTVEHDHVARAKLERSLVEWLRPACNRLTPSAPT